MTFDQLMQKYKDAINVIQDCETFFDSNDLTFTGEDGIQIQQYVWSFMDEYRAEQRKAVP
jgi:hypothetical protein